MYNKKLAYDDEIDSLYRRHDGGQDTPKGVTKASAYIDAAEIPDLDAAALLVYLDIYRGVPCEGGGFAFSPADVLSESAFSRMLTRITSHDYEDVRKIQRVERAMTCGGACSAINAMLGEKVLPEQYPPEEPLTREKAVAMTAAALRISDGSGEMPCLYYVPESTALSRLELPKNTAVASPDGTLVTLTVDGVFQPLVGGYVYEGDIQLTLTERYELYRYTTEPPMPGALPDEPSDLPPEPAWWNYFEEPYRAALYMENGKKVPRRSVDAAWRVLEDGTISIASSDAPSNAFGANHFNGIILTGREGKYQFENLRIRFTGNGMDDFQGMGAGILAAGDRTETVLDHVDIENYGTVRSALVAGGGAKVLVKHSRFSAHDGFFEEGWVGGMGAKKMRTAPIWGGFEGNCRATNLLDKAETTYFDSQIMAEKWGVLSTDNNKGCRCTAVNSLVAITGGLNEKIDTSSEAAARTSLAKIPFSEIYRDIQRDLGDHPFASHKHPGGYGTYSIGNTTVMFAGSTVVAADYGNTCVNAAARVIYCASTPENLKNAYGVEGLSITPQNTVVYADKAGVMLQRGNGGGGVTIRDKTVFHCGMTCFSVKSNGSFTIDVKDSTLISESGNILTLMDDDDLPGVIEDPMIPTARERAEAMELRREGLLDLSRAIPNRDVFLRLTDLSVSGDCFNASGHSGPITRQELEEARQGAKPKGPFSKSPLDAARQLEIQMENVTYSGAISTAEGHHIDRDTGRWLSPVPHEKWYCLAVLECIPRPAYQAGLIVHLSKNSVWSVTRTCYLTALRIDESSRVNGRVYVDGTPVTLEPGIEYTGDITVEPGR